MQRAEIISAIDQELSTLRRVRELLQSSGSSNGIKAIAEKVTAGSGTSGRKRRVMSAEARARIGLAQKKRWAKQRKAESTAGDK